jgi:nicotinamidase-related amidase
MLTAPSGNILQFDPTCTALVIPDPWNRLVSNDGRFRFLPWGPPPPERAVSNFLALVHTARCNQVPVLVSPHYYYPMDHGWHMDGGLERLMNRVGMFQARGPWILENLPDSRDRQGEMQGFPLALEGHESMGLTLELDRRGIRRILLAGLLADHSLRGHLGELQEQGFQVGLVHDATAAVEMLGSPLIEPQAGLPSDVLFTTHDVLGVLQQGSVH